MATKIEPAAPLPSLRFAALEQLRKQGIYAGITYMPILPYITDRVTSVKKLVQLAHSAGACYILPCVGVTLRDGSRDFFFEKLNALSPKLVDTYRAAYGTAYMCRSPKETELYSVFYDECAKKGIATEIEYYKPNRGEQLSIF